MNATITETAPRLYVGTYAKYNSGSINGAWLDLSDYSGREEFIEAAAALHDDESDPEIMYQDYEGFPEAWYCESSAPPAILWEWLELSEEDRDAYAAYLSYNPTGDIDDFRDAYRGTANSEADFCAELAEEQGAIPKDFPNWIHIDWQATWDCNMTHDYWSERGESGELHFFSRG